MYNQRKQPEILFDYCRDWSFFATRDGQAWARPPAAHTRRLYSLHHPDFRHFLAETFAAEFGFAPTNAALRTVIATFDARARHHCHAALNPTLRVAFQPDPRTVAIDSGTYGAWEITAAAIRETEGSVLFFAGRGADPLPDPAPTPDPTALADFRRLLNLATADDWLLLLTWLLAAWHPHGPYPILILQGPEGCGKSQTARALRRLVDPNQAPLHPLPRARRIQPHAYENWVLAFDHVARLSPCTAAMLCALSTGIGYEVPIARDDYIPVQQCRPILLIATPDCRIPADILSRAYVVHLADLPAACRRTEAELNAELDRLRPHMVGHLLKGVQTALQRDKEIKLATLPRMADAALWMAAASPAFDLTESQIEEVLSKPNRIYQKPDPLVPSITALGEWQGTAAQLLDALPPDQRPATEKELGNRLTRMTPQLAAAGIELIRQRTKKTRTIHFHSEIKNSLSPAAGAPTLTAASQDRPEPEDPQSPPVSPSSAKIDACEVSHPTPARDSSATSIALSFASATQ